MGLRSFRAEAGPSSCDYGRASTNSDLQTPLSI